MANIKSQIKRNRQTVKRNERNKSVRSAMKTQKKNALAAAGSGENTDEAMAKAMSAIDRAANKGVIHKKKASRDKARLAKAMKAKAAADA